MGGLAGPELRPAELDAKSRIARCFQVTAVGRDHPRQQRESQGIDANRWPRSLRNADLILLAR